MRKKNIKNTILVIGGAGFVGSNLINYLLKKTKFKIYLRRATVATLMKMVFGIKIVW